MTYYCKICASELRSALRVSPQSDEHVHDATDRACGECWEAWLSLQVEEKRPSEIQRMFCEAKMDAEDIRKFGRRATAYRYAEKLQDGLICMARCNRLRQPFDREEDGRIFNCAYCAFSVCADCDRPEHAAESCTEYRRRLNAVHGDAEAQTRKAFKVCPDCDATIEPEKASCYTQCNCGYQFCSACMTPWAGEGSAYLHGKEAHWPGCKYRTRDAESKHSLVNRWLQTEEVQERLATKAKSNHTRNEARKRARMENTSGLETKRPAKKKRMLD